MRISFAIALAFLLALSSCKEKQNSTSAKKDPASDTTQQVLDTTAAPNFSIRSFFDDQWSTRKGQPYTLLRIVNLNGKIDSSFVELDSTLWAQLRGPFDATDISDKKFNGQYSFDMFDDEASQTSNMNFEARNPDLFMRKMYITADQFSHRVQSVYVETETSRDGYSHSQKLSYIPDRTIQIREFEKSAATPAKNLIIEYRYQY